MSEKKTEKNSEGVVLKPGFIFDPRYGYVPLVNPTKENNTPKPQPKKK